MTGAKFIEVDAGVRYWEDALLNGEADEAGRIPFKNGERWQPVIELATGRVLDWPEGTTADIHYKVCDDGLYWLLDEGRQRIAAWRGHYVPNEILCVGDSGFGDYIILTIGADGLIADWSAPAVLEAEWAPVLQQTEGGRG
jgi:hypothetical protein